MNEDNLQPVGELMALYSIGSDDQDIIPMVEQLEIQDVGELALIAWRVI